MGRDVQVDGADAGADTGAGRYDGLRKSGGGEEIAAGQAVPDARGTHAVFADKGYGQRGGDAESARGIAGSMYTFFLWAGS